MIHYINFNQVTRIKVTFPSVIEDIEYHKNRIIIIPRKFWFVNLKPITKSLDEGWYKKNYFYHEIARYDFIYDVPTFHTNPYGFYEKVDLNSSYIFIDSGKLYKYGEIIFYTTDGNHISLKLTDLKCELYDTIKELIEKYPAIELL